MNAPRGPQCALGKLQYEQMDIESVKREGFLDHGILVLNLADFRLTPMELQIVRAIGNRFYGRAIRG